MKGTERIPMGAAATKQVQVAREMTVAHFHEDMPEVYGTPIMIYHMVATSGDAIQEYLPEGQRVRRYRVEVRQGNEWKTVARGATIGNKKIDIFEPVHADAVSLVVEAQIAEPRIAEFRAYFGRD